MKIVKQEHKERHHVTIQPRYAEKRYNFKVVLEF